MQRGGISNPFERPEGAARRTASRRPRDKTGMPSLELVLNRQVLGGSAFDISRELKRGIGVFVNERLLEQETLVMNPITWTGRGRSAHTPPAGRLVFISEVIARPDRLADHRQYRPGDSTLIGGR